MAEQRTDLDAARRRILADVQPTREREQVVLRDALGRVLADGIVAPMDLPPFPASAMDGYALRSGDAVGAPPHRFTLAGTSYAGRPASGPVPTGACVRIFTGAPVPDGLDAVAIQEDCTRDENGILVHAPVGPGDHVRRAGHDVPAGTPMLDPGRRLTEYDLGWLAACGITAVAVHGRPRIAVFSTGDELVEPGGVLGPGQIFDANRITLSALLAQLPVHVVDLGIVPDDPGAIREALERADRDCQAVVTSGGVSVGEADHVRDVVADVGRLELWKLNLKPGKPLAYGRLRNAAFFGLPGNPVSTVVTALMLVRPALERLCGMEPEAVLAVPAVLRGGIRHQPGREEFQRGTVSSRHGRLEVTVTGDQSSNRLASFSRANCLVRIPKDAGNLVEGAEVQVLLLGRGL